MPLDLSTYEVVLLDLDGTVYHDQHPLPGAVELIRALQSAGRRFACLSNSASSPDRVSQRLARFGVNVDPNHIWTAVSACCEYVLHRFSPRPRVFNLATDSVQQLLEDRVDWVQGIDKPCDVVVSGGPANRYADPDRQRIALELLRHGAALVGISADRVYPSRRGLEFGAGAMCAMLGYSARVEPVFCGKPQAIFFHELCGRLNVEPSRCVLIGDNLESDVAGAKNVGMATILTLSGVTQRRDLQALAENLRPDHVVRDLAELL